MALFEAIPTSDGRRRYNVKSPVTLESIGQFDSATADEVKAAVARARKAQHEWATRSFAERAEVLWRLVDQIVARQDDIVALVIKETGKPRNEAVAMEVLAPCMQISHYAKRAAGYLKTVHRRPTGVMRFSKKLTLTYQPLGVVGSDHALERSRRAGSESARAGADGGQCGGPQAERGDAVLGGPAPRADGRGGLSREPLPGRPGRRPDRRGVDRSGRRQGLVHRQRRDRPQSR